MSTGASGLTWNTSRQEGGVDSSPLGPSAKASAACRTRPGQDVNSSHSTRSKIQGCRLVCYICCQCLSVDVKEGGRGFRWSRMVHGRMEGPGTRVSQSLGVGARGQAGCPFFVSVWLTGDMCATYARPEVKFWCENALRESW